jgi:hypothetical protein
VTAQTVADTLNIGITDLPAGWLNGSPPWARVATIQANVAFANCLGLPLGHIGIITGLSEPAGNKVLSSSWVDSSARPTEGLESDVSLTPSTSTELEDLQALSSSSAPSCFQGWFASLDETGDQIVKAPTVTEMAVPPVAGERGAALALSLVVKSDGARKSVNEEIAFLGAGRVEVGLITQSIGGLIPASLESGALSGLQQRLQAAAS